LATLTVNSAGLAPITITGGGVLLKTINAAGVGGTTAFTASATNTLPAGFSLTTGTGADIVGGFTGNDTLDGGAGNDTISGLQGADILTGGAGADTFVFGLNSATAGAAQVSGAVLTDIITDFVSGTDKLSLAQATSFNGVYSNLTSGLAAVVPAGSGGVAGQAFFSVADNSVYVVNATTGVLSQTDTVVKLDKVTTITPADVSLGSVGGSVLALSALAQSITATSTTPGASTTFNDSISGTIANVAGATTLVGGLGTDSVTLTDGGTFAAPALFNSIETLVLSSAAANSITIVTGAANHALRNITGGTLNDTVDVTNLVAGGAVALGDGADSLTAMTVAIASAVGSTYNGGANGVGTVDTVTFAAAQTIAATTLDQFTAFEAVNFGQIGAASAVTLPTTNSLTSIAVDTTNFALTVTGTAAQLSALTSITNTNGTNTLNFTVSDTTAINLNITGWVVGGANDIDVITLAGGADTLTTTAANLVAITGVVAAAGAGDTLVITTSNTTGTVLAKFAQFENITAGGTAAQNLYDIGDVARLITGNAAANVIQPSADGVAISAAKTVALGSDAAIDRVVIDQIGTDSAVTTVTGFVVANDVIDLNTSGGSATAEVITSNVAIPGFTVGGGAAIAAGAVVQAMILGSAAAQISGALTNTGNAGAVEAAVIAGGLLTVTATNVAVTAYVVLDNGTDTGIYRVVLDNAVDDASAGLAIDTAAELTVTLVGVLTGIADASTLGAANFV